MQNVWAPIVLLIIFFMSILVNRIATVALTFTGMSKEMARFQARSAFTTVGFTTTESESVVNHPVRRRIISLLMLLGNAGIVTVMATLITAFIDAQSSVAKHPLLTNLLVLSVGGAGLFWFATSRWLDARLFTVISWALRRWVRLEVHDFLELLHLADEFSVTEVEIGEDDWLPGNRLIDLRLADVGINVLGIRRAGGEFVGTPVGSTYVRRGDHLVVYGSREDVKIFDARRTAPDGPEHHYAQVEARRKAEEAKQTEDDRTGRES